MSGALVIRKDEPPEEPETKLDVSIFDEEKPVVVAMDLGTEIAFDDVIVQWEQDLDISRMVYIRVGLNAAGHVVARFELDYHYDLARDAFACFNPK